MLVALQFQAQTAGGTDILVSWIYKLTMQSGQYALAAALTLLLSVFVIGIAICN